MWGLWWKRWYLDRFYRVLRFPLPILNPANAPYPSTEAGTTAQIVAEVEARGSAVG
jgi:hypothetical protein